MSAVTNENLPASLDTRSCPPCINPLELSVGWNAAIVGLLSCILVMVFLLTTLYYMVNRRRCRKEVSGCPSPVPLLEKVSTNMVTNTSQTALTTFVNETGKDTKLTIHTEQTGNGDLAGMSTIGNGHTSPSHSNGILANGNADQSDLHLLQHEDH